MEAEAGLTNSGWMPCWIKAIPAACRLSMSPKFGCAPVVQEVCIAVNSAASCWLKAADGSGATVGLANAKTLGKVIARPLKAQ